MRGRLGPRPRLSGDAQTSAAAGARHAPQDIHSDDDGQVRHVIAIVSMAIRRQAPPGAFKGQAEPPGPVKKAPIQKFSASRAPTLLDPIEETPDPVAGTVGMAVEETDDRMVMAGS
jgi:hypothetical protein